MDIILQWVQENLSQIFTFSGLAALGAYVTYWFSSKVVPKIIDKVVLMFAKLVSNLFGVSFGDGQDMVEQLPVVTEINKLKNDIKTNNELKLLELKQKLASPLYSALEKAPLQTAFNYLYEQIKNQLSPEIKAALDAIDQLSIE